MATNYASYGDYDGSRVRAQTLLCDDESSTVVHSLAHRTAVRGIGFQLRRATNRFSKNISGWLGPILSSHSAVDNASCLQHKSRYVELTGSTMLHCACWEASCMLVWCANDVLIELATRLSVGVWTVEAEAGQIVHGRYQVLPCNIQQKCLRLEIPWSTLIVPAYSTGNISGFAAFRAM